jgi:hypothetical protein
VPACCHFIFLLLSIRGDGRGYLPLSRGTYV